METRHQEDRRFGTIAIEMGFITAKQLGKAVTIQMGEDLMGEGHRLLGTILVELGYIRTSQVTEVLAVLNVNIGEDKL